MTATQYSYRQYAGNGSTTSFAVPFPYLLKSHVHVYLGFNLLDGTFTSELAETTGFAWTSGTAIQTVAAPTSGQTLTVVRQTPNSQQVVQYQDGSTLIADDLNTSDLQNLYVVQEQQDRNDSGIAISLSASTKADQAIAAVSNSIRYQLVTNVAGIPSSPANDTYIEIANSTGLESFSPLTGLPAGFVGDSGLTVRLRYTTTGATWTWQNYYANNAEIRYLKLAGGTLTGPLTLSGTPTSSLQAATKAYADGIGSGKLDSATAASTYQTLSGMSSYAALGTAQSFTKAQRGTPIGLTDGATITPDFSLGNNYAVTLAGNRTLANPTNLTAGQSGVITVGQDSSGSRTLAFGSYWKFPGGTAPTLTTTANAVDVLAYYVESGTRITARLVSDVK
jgi:hypothetical protein